MASWLLVFVSFALIYEQLPAEATPAPTSPPSSAPSPSPSLAPTPSPTYSHIICVTEAEIEQETTEVPEEESQETEEEQESSENTPSPTLSPTTVTDTIIGEYFYDQTRPKEAYHTYIKRTIVPDMEDMFIYWFGNESTWVIAGTTDDTDILALCNDTSQDDYDSPADCNEFITIDDEIHMAIVVEANQCPIDTEERNCWLDPLHSQCWYVWVIESVVILLIGAAIIYCMWCFCCRNDGFTRPPEIDDSEREWDEDDDQEKVLMLNEEEHKQRVELKPFQISKEDHDKMLEIEKNLSISVGLQRD